MAAKLCLRSINSFSFATDTIAFTSKGIYFEIIVSKQNLKVVIKNLEEKVWEEKVWGLKYGIHRS